MIYMDISADNDTNNDTPVKFTCTCTVAVMFGADA